MVTGTAAREIRESRLLVSAPETVYVELERYGTMLKSDRYAGDDDLEANLLARNDRLIDLGLALHCQDVDVWKALYQKSKAVADGTDARYLSGLRLACLSNENAGGIFSGFPSIDATELAELLRAGPDEAIHAVLQNASIDEKLLVQLYKREGPFVSVGEDRWRQIVYSSAENLRLVNDTSDEHGPDLPYADIREAILHLLINAPVTWLWLETLNYLHFCLLKGEFPSCGVDITEVAARWSKLEPDDGKNEPEGYFGGGAITQKQEFIAIISAMYGLRVYKNGEKYESCIVGSLESPGLSHRCAFYGHGTLSINDMDSAYHRDGEAFTLAALCNETLYFDNALRAKLEDKLGYRQRWIYTARCESIAKRRRSGFNPQPVSEDIRDDEDASVPTPSTEVLAIKALEVTVKALETKLAANRLMMLWGFVIVGLLIWMR